MPGIVGRTIDPVEVLFDSLGGGKHSFGFGLFEFKGACLRNDNLRGGRRGLECGGPRLRRYLGKHLVAMKPHSIEAPVTARSAPGAIKDSMFVESRRDVFTDPKFSSTSDLVSDTPPDGRRQRRRIVYASLARHRMIQGLRCPQCVRHVRLTCSQSVHHWQVSSRTSRKLWGVEHAERKWLSG